MPDDDDLPPELGPSIQELDRDLEEIGTEYPRELNAAPIPPLMHHYTDDVGLRGILDSGKLWVTDIFYLNDPSELKYGVSIATETLARIAAGGPPEHRLFAHDFRQYEDRAAERVAHYFVCSFSKLPNDLGQWRAYANNGRGYSIGFDGPLLEDAFCKIGGQPIPERMSFPVSYDENRLRAICTRFANRVLPLALPATGTTHPRSVIDSYNRALRVSLALQVYRTALFFKHHGYASEQEYRLMQVNPINNPPTGLSFRNRPNELLRYLEFDWKTLAAGSLKQIIIGPGNDPNIGLRYVYDCLRAYFPTPPAPVNVTYSAIPYRPR